MDVLRCKTPGLVRAEFWMHLLAYNLIRAVMAQAARSQERDPRALSFAGAAQAVRAFGERLQEADATRASQLQACLLIVVGGHRVGNRPDRVEPRARKRRPKHGALLTKPRKQARAELLTGVRG